MPGRVLGGRREKNLAAAQGAPPSALACRLTHFPRTLCSVTTQPSSRVLNNRNSCDTDSLFFCGTCSLRQRSGFSGTIVTSVTGVSTEKVFTFEAALTSRTGTCPGNNCPSPTCPPLETAKTEGQRPWQIHLSLAGSVNYIYKWTDLRTEWPWNRFHFLSKKKKKKSKKI